MKEQKDILLSPHLTSSNEAALSHTNEFDGVRLSPHFKLSEFTKSITAERLGISNKPDYEQVLGVEHFERYRTGTYRHICKHCYWQVYGRRLRQRYILRQMSYIQR